MSTAGVSPTRSIRIFISHVSEDIDRLQPLLCALDAWDVDYWYDGVMRAGDPITPEIHKEISTRDYFIRVVSIPMRRKPTWVNIETDIFLGLQSQDKAKGSDRRRLINLVLDPGCGDAETYGQVVPIKAYELALNKWMGKLREALPLTLSANLNKTKASNDPLQPISDPEILTMSGLPIPPIRKAPPSIQQTKRRDPPTTPPATLLVVRAPETHRFVLSEDTTLIQRADPASISLQDETVSRVHATITRTLDGGYEICDGDGRTESTNHTFVEGKLATLSGIRLKNGDLVVVGETTLRFQE